MSKNIPSKESLSYVSLLTLDLIQHDKLRSCDLKIVNIMISSVCKIYPQGKVLRYHSVSSRAQYVNTQYTNIFFVDFMTI